jgi:hypothetical protein
VLFKGRAIFKKYVPNKYKQFEIKICKLCNSNGYTHNRRVYSGKDRKRATDTITGTHATVTALTTKTENVGHKLYMDNFLFTRIVQ